MQIQALKINLDKEPGDVFNKEVIQEFISDNLEAKSLSSVFKENGEIGVSSDEEYSKYEKLFENYITEAYGSKLLYKDSVSDERYGRTAEFNYIKRLITEETEQFIDINNTEDSSVVIFYYFNSGNKQLGINLRKIAEELNLDYIKFNIED